MTKRHRRLSRFWFYRNYVPWPVSCDKRLVAFYSKQATVVADTAAIEVREVERGLFSHP